MGVNEVTRGVAGANDTVVVAAGLFVVQLRESLSGARGLSVVPSASGHCAVNSLDSISGSPSLRVSSGGCLYLCDVQQQDSICGKIPR